MPLRKLHAPFGEDACVVASRCVVVADGVGGFHARHGTSSAAFAARLAAAVGDAASGGGDLADAARAAIARCGGRAPPGAATLLAARLDAAACALDVVVVGDCGLRLLRRGGGGDGPWRVSWRSPGWRAPASGGRRVAPSQVSRQPGARDATLAGLLDRARAPAARGDLVVVGTDGLWDNLDEDEVLRAVARAPAPRAAATAIARAARAARRKPDDITVAVGLVK